MSKEVNLDPLIEKGIIQLLKKNLSISTDIGWEHDTKILTTKLFFAGKEICKDKVILGHDDDF